MLIDISEIADRFPDFRVAVVVATGLSIEAGRSVALDGLIGDYEAETNREPITPIYHFDHDVRSGEDIEFDSAGMSLRGYGQKIDLDLANKYADMCR